MNFALAVWENNSVSPKSLRLAAYQSSHIQTCCFGPAGLQTLHFWCFSRYHLNAEYVSRGGGASYCGCSSSFYSLLRGPLRLWCVWSCRQYSSIGASAVGQAYCSPCRRGVGDTKMESLEMSVSSNASVSFLSRCCPLWRLAGLSYFQIVSQCTLISHWIFFAQRTIAALIDIVVIFF